MWTGSTSIRSIICVSHGTREEVPRQLIALDPQRVSSNRYCRQLFKLSDLHRAEDYFVNPWRQVITLARS